MARRHAAHTFAAMTSISSKAALAASAFAVLAAGSAQAATRSVDVGPGAKAHLPKNRTYDANAFLPGTVTVHVGDKVKFNLNGFHTVTFGDQSKTPLFIADPGKPSGEKDSQGNPFWFTDRDRIIANPAAIFPAPGVNSGVSLGGKPKPFVKTFAKPGTFAYFCAVHPGMTGKVKVVAKGRKIPSQAAVAKQAKKELAGYAARAKAADKAGQSAANTIQAGADGKGFVNYAFYPAHLTVPVNTPVTLEMSPGSTETHTFSFGAAASLQALAQGQITPVPDPAGGPPAIVGSSAVFLQSDAELPVYDGTNHGDGFWSTGTLSSPGHPVDGILPSGLGKFPSKQTITFAKPGTYTYVCLIHPEMQGTVEVTS
jgi:plastocyanin